MSDIMQLVLDQLGGHEIERIGGIIDADASSTERAVGAALPLLLAGLARNANSSPEGAQSLNVALERDHDGSLLGSLGDLFETLGGPRGRGPGGGGGAFGPSGRAIDGAGILEHVLGGRRNRVESGVSRASGLDPSQIAKLLPILAPIVMAALGRMKRDEKLGPDEIAGRLDRDARRVEEETGLGGIIGNLLDSDDDGSVLDDLARLGSSGLLGSLLRRD